MQNNVIELGRPNPKQEIFLRDHHTHVGFGGARGGGKSWAIRFKAVVLCLKHPGIKCMIVRKTYPELIANHVKPLKEMLHCGQIGAPAVYNESNKEMRFHNGSTILLRYCDREADCDRFQGTEVDCLFLDEATLLSEEQMKKLCACVRGANSYPHRTYYTMNPGGVGHGFIKRIFIDRKYEIGENPDDYSFTQSLVTDNYALQEKDPGYVKMLEALPAKVKKAWLEGDWNVYTGAFFSEFRIEPDIVKCAEAGITVEQAKEERRWTHVIKPFTPPKHWKCYRSYDWGYGRPFSCTWTFLDEDNVAYRAIQLYGCTGVPNEGVRWSNKEQFDKIAEIEHQHPWLVGRRIQGVADPSIWDGSHGISAAEEAEKHGLWFEPGINDRIAGWMQVRERLRFDDDGYPMLYFFDTCKDDIRTIPLMQHDETKVEDLDSSLEDHACDELRYFCMGHRIAPRVIEDKISIMADPLNQFTTDRYNNIVIRR